MGCSEDTLIGWVAEGFAKSKVSPRFEGRFEGKSQESGEFGQEMKHSDGLGGFLS